MRSWRIALGCALLLVAAASSIDAAEPRYSFLEAGYSRVSPNGGDNANGWFLGGSFKVTTFHFFAEIRDVGDLEGWQIGGGWQGLLGQPADLVAELSYMDADIEKGIDVAFGVRWMVAQSIELNAYAHWSDMDVLNRTSLELNGIWDFTRNFGVGAGYTIGDELDDFRAYVRFNFKKN